MSSDFSRCDIICDRYFLKSLKEDTHRKLRLGSEFKIYNETKTQTNFDDFLRCSENKGWRNNYLT